MKHIKHISTNIKNTKTYARKYNPKPIKSINKDIYIYIYNIPKHIKTIKSTQGNIYKINKINKNT